MRFGFTRKKKRIDTIERYQPANTDDPAWQGYERMRQTRIEAMRESTRTGKPYRDPYEDQFPLRD